MKNIGFNNLTYKDFNAYKIYEDSKIHSFCNYLETDSDMKERSYPNRFFVSSIGNMCNELASKKTYGEEGYKLTDIKRNDISNYGYDENNEVIPQIESVSGIDNTVIVEGLETTDITHQIVNTKRVDIIFNIYLTKNEGEENKVNDGMYSINALEQKKYIDDVILPYLEQILLLSPKI